MNAELPFSLLVEHPDVSGLLRDIYGHRLMEVVSAACLSAGGDADPSVTLRDIMPDMGGIPEHRLELTAYQFCMGVTPLLAMTREGQTYRVRVTPRGRGVIREIKLKEAEKADAFRQAIGDNWGSLCRGARLPVEGPDDLPQSLRREISGAVKGDLDGVLSILSKFRHSRVRVRRSPKDEDIPILAACLKLSTRLYVQGTAGGAGRKDSRRLQTDARAVADHVIDIAQREILQYLVEVRYADFLSGLGGLDQGSKPLLIVMDLDVVIAHVCDADPLRIRVDECLAIARQLGAQRKINGSLAVPRGFQYMLKDLLNLTRKDWQRLQFLRTPRMWADPQYRGEFDTILARLARFSIFREYVFRWPDRTTFEDCIDSKMAALRRMARDYTSIQMAGDDRWTIRGHNDQVSALMHYLRDTRAGVEPMLWTFNRRVQHIRNTVYGGVMRAFLDPDSMTKVSEEEKRLEALGDLSWWKENLIRSDAPEFAQHTTAQLREAVERKVNLHA